MSAPIPHQRLTLEVLNEKITWTLYRRLRDGVEHRMLPSNSVPLGLDPLRKHTIELLVELQQLLSDAVRESENARRRLCAKEKDLPEDVRHDLTDILKGSTFEPEALNETLYKLVRILGQHLYSALFPQEVHRDLTATLENLKGNELLRIELDFRGSQESLLRSWPWEYLYRPLDSQTPHTGRFLAEMAQLVLNRILWAGRFDPEFSLSTPRPVKLLLVISAPRDLGPVQGGAVERAVQELAEKGIINLTVLKTPEFVPSPEYHPEVDRKSFEEAVKRDKPHIIHFIGHGQREGGKGQLAFLNTEGKAQWVDGDRFAEDVGQSKELKLVFLQACESALPDPYSPVSGVALKLAHGRIPAIVAMQAKVDNEVANTFAMRFYGVLAEGGSVDQAVMEGRKEIRDKLSEQMLAFGIPVLYLRSYEQLIELAPTAPAKGSSREAPPVSRLERSCPRCEARIRSEQQKLCTNCGLAFWCANEACPRPLLDAPDERLCGECGTPVPPSSPWPHAHEEAAGGPPAAASAFGAAPAASSRDATVVNLRSRLAGGTEQ